MVSGFGWLRVLGKERDFAHETGAVVSKQAPAIAAQQCRAAVCSAIIRTIVHYQ